MVLHAHRADVVQLAPHTAAKICSLWLRIMPTVVGDELRFVPSGSKQASAGNDLHGRPIEPC